MNGLIETVLMFQIGSVWGCIGFGVGLGIEVEAAVGGRSIEILPKWFPVIIMRGRGTVGIYGMWTDQSMIMMIVTSFHVSGKRSASIVGMLSDGVFLVEYIVHNSVVYIVLVTIAIVLESVVVGTSLVNGIIGINIRVCRIKGFVTNIVV